MNYPTFDDLKKAGNALPKPKYKIGQMVYYMNEGKYTVELIIGIVFDGLEWNNQYLTRNEKEEYDIYQYKRLLNKGIEASGIIRISPWDWYMDEKDVYATEKECLDIVIANSKKNLNELKSRNS